MIALLLAGFLIYLYAPHLLFKFAAANQYDFLATPKGLPQVEEFFNAGLPSAALNGITFVLLRLFRYDVAIDRVVVGSVFTEKPDLTTYFQHGDLRPLAVYLATLLFTSYIAGHLYGRAATAFAETGGSHGYLDGASGWTWFRRWIVVAYKTVWSTFYAKFEQPLYPQILRQSWAFVHTHDGLYHGRLYAYEKDADGNLYGLYLITASRFSRKKEEECFAARENPIRDLTGPIFIKWSEVLDINYPPGREILDQKRKYYEEKIKQYVLRRRPLQRIASFLRKLS